jgi:hypothetical protein
MAARLRSVISVRRREAPAAVVTRAHAGGPRAGRPGGATEGVEPHQHRPAAMTRGGANSGPSPITTAAAQPSASGSRAASTWMQQFAAERANMPLDRSTATTSGHTPRSEGSPGRCPRRSPPLARAGRVAAGLGISQHWTSVTRGTPPNRPRPGRIPPRWQRPPAGPTPIDGSRSPYRFGS